MEIQAGLFSHLDSIVKLNSTVVEKLKEVPRVLKFIKKGKEGEKIISKKEFEKLRQLFPSRIKRLGGNATNSALTLWEFGFKPILSTPIRPKILMELLEGKVWIVKDKRLVNPIKDIREDPIFEHFIFENDKRYIFTWDKMVREFWIDLDWLEYIKEGYLFLSGFHLINYKFKRKIDEFVDYMKNKNLYVHLEFGNYSKSMDYAFRKLIPYLNSIGMNKEEWGKFSQKHNAFEIFKEGIELIIHTPQKIILFTKNKDNVKIGILGALFIAKKAHKSNFYLIYNKTKINKIEGGFLIEIPTFYSEETKTVTGLGDSLSTFISFFKINPLPSYKFL